MSEKYIELEQILSDLLGDLTIAVTVLKDYESKSWFHDKDNDSSKRCIWRLCIFSIVMGCCKYVELNRKYGKEFKDLIPEHTKVRGQFTEKIKSNRSINKLRNHCVAHVTEKSTYLKPQEVQNEIVSMFGGRSANAFLDWICPDDIANVPKSESLVSVIETLRDAVSSKL